MQTAHRFTLIALLVTGIAGTGNAALPATNAPRSAPIAQAAEPSVVRRGENVRVWQTIKAVTNRVGERVKVLNFTNSYIELGAGICYETPDGKWEDSKAEIGLSFDGGAEATQTPHKVRFTPDIYSVGAVRVTLPEGQTMSSTIRGLFFYERESQRSVLISEITNSIGVLHPPNKIVYSNCFARLKADVVLTVTAAGLEQDVILREQLPFSPEDAGLDPAKSVLECWTEFFESPVPGKRASSPAQTNDLAAETLTFGKMVMRGGRAFALADASMPRSGARNSLRVLKTWEQLEDDRSFLIEAVRWPEINVKLQTLGTNSAPLSITNRPVRSAAAKRTAPSRLVAAARHDGVIRVAARGTVEIEMGNAFVLDYVLVNGSFSTYTFHPTNYYISGPVYISGEARFIGGTVIKFAPAGSGASIQMDGAVVCDTGPGRPAILTGRDDDSVGEIVAGSTGSPSQGGYGNPALGINSRADLKYMRISYAARAIDFNNPGIDNLLTHSQITHCSASLFAYHNVLAARNVLVHNVDQVFEGESFSIEAEHLTARLAFDLAMPWDFSGTINLVNSLVVGIPWCSATLTSDHSEWLVNDDPIFETFALGSHYLPAASPYKRAGTPNINGALKAELRFKTTSIPVVLPSGILQDTILAPVERNFGPDYDLGYSYDAIDYIANNVWVQDTTLLLTNGVVIGMNGGSYAFGLGSSGRFVSEGSPLNLNRLVHVRSIHERAAASWQQTFIDNYDNSAPSHLILRFTDLPVQAGSDDYHFAGGLCLGTLAMKDCRLSGGRLSAGFEGPNSRMLGITNNIFEGVRTTIASGGASVNVQIRNNLFKNGSLDFSGGNLAWQAYDNLFDTVALSVNNNPIGASHNAYYQTTPFPISHVHYVLPSPVNFQPGPLGRYYLPAGSSVLLNGGSRTAAAAGLYHYTVKVDQWKAGVPIPPATVPPTVSVGHHYVALNSSQNNTPYDGDGDWIPDFYEDTDGDGVADSGESNWQTSINGLTAASTLDLFTPLK